MWEYAVTGLAVGGAVAAGLTAWWKSRGIARLEAERNAAQQQLAALNAQVGALAADQQSLARRLEEERISSSAQLVTLTAEKERAAALLGAAEREKHQLEGALADRQAAIETLQSRIKTLEQERSAAQTERDVVFQKLADLQNRHNEVVARADSLAAAERQSAQEIASLQARIASLESQLQARSQQLAEQKTWVEEQTRHLHEQFSSAAAKLLEDKALRFTEVNKKELDTLIAPFREQLVEFRTRIDHIYQEDTKDRSELRQKINDLAQLNQTISKQALDLTNALTISSKSTGNWGETILRKILEDSGLREGHEYSMQVRVVTEEGAPQQPDAVIFLPENRQVVVDAKCSNKAWRDYCAATDDAQRQQCMKEHLASLRAHIRGLAARDYSRSPTLKSVDFVLMFVPVESALTQALIEDESLYAEAYRSKVILVSPSILMAVIKLIEGMWVVQHRTEHAEKIAEAGRKLYEKLTGFARTFMQVGASIGAARESFEKAQQQLASGKGNAIRLAERMVEYGVRPAQGKALPEALVQMAREGEEEESEPMRPRAGQVTLGLPEPEDA